MFTIKALLSLHHAAHSTPQFFAQSFASSSVIKPDGQVSSNSIYTDTQGNRIVNGKVNPGFGKTIPVLINELIPPPLPGQPKIPVLSFQPVSNSLLNKVTSSPVKSPKTTTVKVTTPATTSFTTRITPKATSSLVTTTPTTTRVISVPSTRAKKPAAPRTTTLFVKRPTLGAKISGSKNEGFYVHDNKGVYKADDRGKYRPNYYKAKSAQKLL